MSLYLGEKLISGIGQDRIADTLPIGAIIEWDSDLIPENWLLLNGQAVSRTVYSELFAIYGTTYGAGDGSTTFNLPDRRTRVPVGKDVNDEDFAALGITGGEKEHTLTVDEMPSHNHGTSHYSNYVNTVNTGGYSVVQHTTGYNTENTGGSQPHNNLQPYIVTNFIVKAKLYTTEFIGGNMVIDNLTSDSSVNVLSARMGKELDAADKVLDTKIQKLSEEKLDKSEVLDYVIERGTDVKGYTSWTWEKWASGKVEMSGYFYKPSVIFNTSQNGWYAADNIVIEYPFSLVSDEFGQYCYPSVNGDTQNRMVVSYVIPSANSISVLVLNSAQQTSGVYTKLWIRVTGRWK